MLLLILLILLSWAIKDVAGGKIPGVEDTTPADSVEDFLHDVEIVSNSYLTYGDYGCHLGNYAAPDTVSSDFVYYDQRWFEMLTADSEERLLRSLERPSERDRFFFFGCRSLANHIRALSALLVIAPGKDVHATIMLQDLLTQRSEHLVKALPGSTLDKLQALAKDLRQRGPKAVVPYFGQLGAMNAFERALVERVYLQQGTANGTLSDYLLINMRLLEQMAQPGDRPGVVHVTPDYTKLLGNAILSKCSKEHRAISFFLQNIYGSHKDLFVNVLYYLNIVPSGLDCILRTIEAERLDSLQNIPADSFFPRVQYPLYPTLYLVHAPIFQRNRASHVGLFHFSSSWGEDSLPGSAHRVIVAPGNEQGEVNTSSSEHKIKVNLSRADKKLTIRAGFPFNLFRIRESSKGKLTMTVYESNARNATDATTNGATQWSMLFTEYRRGDILGVFHGNEQLSGDIATAMDLAWSGTRREILLQVAASLQPHSFYHVMLIEGQPKPRHNK
jgi:hypothetical protein